MSKQATTTAAQAVPETSNRRRGFFITAGAALVALAWAGSRRSATAAANATTSGPVTIVPFSDAGVRQAPVALPKVVKSDDDWKKQLDATQFTVARKEGTERPFSGVTWNLHDKGLYRCVCCATRCSIPRPSSSPVPAGRASGSRSRRRTSSRPPTAA